MVLVDFCERIFQPQSGHDSLIQNHWDSGMCFYWRNWKEVRTNSKFPVVQTHKKIKIKLKKIHIVVPKTNIPI